MSTFTFWGAMTAFFVFEHFRYGLDLNYAAVPSLVVVVNSCWQFIKKGIKNGFYPKYKDLYLDEDERELK